MSSKATGVRAKASASGATTGAARGAERESKDRVTVEEMLGILQSKDEDLERMKATYVQAHARLERLVVQLDKFAKRTQRQE